MEFDAASMMLEFGENFPSYLTIFIKHYMIFDKKIAPKFMSKAVYNNVEYIQHYYCP